MAALILSLPLFAQDTGESGGTLFVLTDPLCALVTLDGQQLEADTPLLVRGLSPGRHVLTTAKPGFVEQTVRFEIGEGGTKVLDLQLVRHSIDVMFPPGDTVVLQGEEFDTTDRFVRADPGTYRISRVGTRIEVTPQFPMQTLIDGLSIAIPIFLGFATYLTIDAIVNPPESGAVPPVVLASHISNLLLIGTDIALNVARSDYLRSVPASTPKHTESETDVAALYDQGEASLTIGELEEASAAFQEITGKFPESRFFPFALYREALIHYVLGDDVRAEEDFQLLIADYPHPELYDKALRNLADICAARGDLAGAIESLENMVYLDPAYTQEEIRVLIDDLSESAAARTR